MITTTFTEAEDFLNNAGFNQIAGDIIFSTFQNKDGDCAFIWANDMEKNGTFTVEIN